MPAAILAADPHCRGEGTFSLKNVEEPLGERLPCVFLKFQRDGEAVHILIVAVEHSRCCSICAQDDAGVDECACQRLVTAGGCQRRIAGAGCLQKSIDLIVYLS